MTDPDTITELDVIEPEYAAMRAWVRCEECDDMAEAIDMCYQHDGSWLCPRCDREHKDDWDSFMSAARGW
jgi:formylmethanofuran dehydrogenase subunit E